MRLRWVCLQSNVLVAMDGVLVVEGRILCILEALHSAQFSIREKQNNVIVFVVSLRSAVACFG